MFDWKALVKTVAPVLGTALGGPLGGMAARVVAGAVLGDEAASEGDVAAALQSATPDQLLALKKADQDFAVQMKELDIDLERIAAADRDSARERETRTGDSWTPRCLAAGVTLGFFAVLYMLMRHGIPPDAGGNALLIMLGALGTAWTAIVAYYFGSSAGSAAKNAMIDRMKGG